MNLLHSIFVVGFPNSSVPSQIGFGNRVTQKKSKNVGAIAGGTVGGVIGLALIILAAFLFVRHRRRHSSSSHTSVSYSQRDDESKAQYITYAGSSAYGSPSPPSTAGLYRPLLPEPQSPEAPRFNIPQSTFSVPTDLHSGSVPAQSYHSVSQVVSDSRPSNVLGSPQTSPLANQFNHQEITNNQSYRNIYPLDSTVASPSGTGYTIEPFQMPAESTQAESRPDSKSAIRISNPTETDVNPPPAYAPAQDAQSTTIVGSPSSAPQRPT